MLTKPNQQLLKLLLNSFRNLKNCDPKWRFKNFERTCEVRKEIVFKIQVNPHLTDYFRKSTLKFRQFNNKGQSISCKRLWISLLLLRFYEVPHTIRYKLVITRSYQMTSERASKVRWKEFLAMNVIFGSITLSN